MSERLPGVECNRKPIDDAKKKPWSGGQEKEGHCLTCGRRMLTMDHGEKKTPKT